MKSNRKAKTIILIIFGIIFTYSPIIIKNSSFSTRNHYINSNYNDEFNQYNLKISAVTGKIHIDNNWTDAKDAGICTGNGTYSEPYIIEDLEINGQGTGSCILIENFNEYFRIENCILYNSDVGINLLNVNNSQLIGNDCSANGYGIDLSWGGYNNTVTGNILNNNGAGIFLSGNWYNTISGNTVNNNTWGGMYLLGGGNNTISGNTANDNFLGIQLYSSHNDTILGNTANDNNVNGMQLFHSYNNTISENTVNNNYYDGIYLENGTNNIVLGNTVTNNANVGISLDHSRYNSISENIVDNSLIGICLVQSENNAIFLNCFAKNTLNAMDTGSDNHWDNGIRGNYWDDYTGLDADGNGIGDNPYSIIGSAGSQDNFPLMRCPISAQDGESPIDLNILISVISGGALIGVVTLLLIRRKRKRIE